MNRLKKWVSALNERFSKVQIGAIVILVVFAFVIGDSNIFNVIGNKFKITELTKQIAYYRHDTSVNREKLIELTTSKANIEKFARENYLMKKPGEDVFIVK